MSNHPVKIPRDISDVELAFPANVKDLMVPYEDIPDEYKHGNTTGNKLFTDMFFFGIEDIQLVPKKGIDPEKALRHIMAIARSFQPKHHHKEACVAYLLEEWFKKMKWKRCERKQ